MGFSLAKAVVVSAVLTCISGVEPSSALRPYLQSLVVNSELGLNTLRELVIIFVLFHSLNHAASYWFSVSYATTFPGLGEHAPPIWLLHSIL